MNSRLRVSAVNPAVQIKNESQDPCSAAFDLHSACRDQVDRLWQNDPLRLFHDASLKSLGSIVLLDVHSLLKDDRTGIQILIHKVDRGTRYFDSALQRLSCTWRP